MAFESSTRGLARVAIELALLAACLGCFARAPAPLPELTTEAAQERPTSVALSVRLQFGEAADLDLYVTDPKQETVYFGNNPSLAGGVLEADMRCDDAPPRIETVRFSDPEPGRYRVGVDFAARCRRLRAPVPYRVEVQQGEMRQLVEGEIPPGRFQNIVLEFDVER